MKSKPVINLVDVPLRDTGHGDAFKAKVGSFGRSIGSSGLGAMLHVVEPGKKAFPLHNHHSIHELFVILDGEGEYRFGGESYPIRAGDVCAAPTGGPETAHQIVNTGKSTLRYLGISTLSNTEVVEYPDSGKFAVTSRYDWATGKGGVRFVGRVSASSGGSKTHATIGTGNDAGLERRYGCFEASLNANLEARTIASPGHG